MLRRIGLLLLAASIAVVGAAFLITAFYRWLDAMFSSTLAAAITGGAMLILAAVPLAIGLSGKEPPLSVSDLTLGLLSIASRAIRSHPEKALIAAAIAGVLEEWLAPPPKKKAAKAETPPT